MEGLVLRQLIFSIIICLCIAAGARKLGYSGLLWFVLSVLSGPIFALALLPSLPNRATDKIRREERSRLDKELGTARRHQHGEGGALPDGTIGDDKTVLG